MSTLAKKTGSGDVLNLGPMPPAGMHQAVCVEAKDLGVVERTFENKPRTGPMVALIWQLNLRDPKTGLRYLVAKRYSLSLNERSALRKDLESWFSTRITAKQEDEGIELKNLVGRNCMVNVLMVTKPTGTYANVEGVMPRIAQLPVITAENYTPRTVEEESADHDDADNPFAQDTTGAPSVGAGATAPAAATDDIPF